MPIHGLFSSKKIVIFIRSLCHPQATPKQHLSLFGAHVLGTPSDYAPRWCAGKSGSSIIESADYYRSGAGSLLRASM
jgi:hypothetical protein